MCFNFYILKVHKALKTIPGFKLKQISISSTLIFLLLITSSCFAQNPRNFGSDIKIADPSGHVWKEI